MSQDQLSKRDTSATRNKELQKPRSEEQYTRPLKSSERKSQRPIEDRRTPSQKPNPPLRSIAKNDNHDTASAYRRHWTYVTSGTGQSKGRQERKPHRHLCLRSRNTKEKGPGGRASLEQPQTSHSSLLPQSEPIQPPLPHNPLPQGNRPHAILRHVPTLG